MIEYDLPPGALEIRYVTPDGGRLFYHRKGNFPVSTEVEFAEAMRGALYAFQDGLHAYGYLKWSHE